MHNVIFLELEPFIINNILDTHVMQSISFQANHFDSVKLTFTIFGNTSHTFFDAEEILSSRFQKETKMGERIHSFTLGSKMDETSADFGLKAIFDGIKVNMTVEIEPSSIAAGRYFIFMGMFLIFLILMLILPNGSESTIAFSLVSLICLCYELGISEPMISTSSFAIDHHPYRFPVKYSPFFSAPNEAAAKKIIEKAKQSESNFKRCVRCNLNFVKTKSNSTPRDLIVTVAFQVVRNLNEFVRTIRSTGCQAQIAIFTDIKAPKEIEEDCDVTIIPIEYDYEFWKKNRYIALNGMRAKLISHLLNLIPDGVLDRVLHADLFDTVFQGDPFVESFTKNTFILSNEGKLVRESGFNNVFRNNGVLGFPWSTMGNMSIYCAGLFAGGFDSIKFFYNTMSNWFTYRIEDTLFNDQHYYYMLVVTQFFRNLNNIVDSVSGDFFTSLAIMANQFSNEFPTHRHGFNSTPIVVHQMNREPLKVYKDLVTKQCS